jgi:DNA recombination protein RmuC
MTDILLMILIVLLLIVFVLLLMVFLNQRQLQKTPHQDVNIPLLLEEQRRVNLLDFQQAVKTQNDEINRLKDVVTSSMSEAQKLNQKDLYNFLEETKGKLQQLQLNFNKETADVKTQNITSIKDLIGQTNKELEALKTKILSDIHDTTQKNNQNLNQQNLKTQEQITTQIQTLKDQVQQSLMQGFEKNEKSMQEFIEKTALLEASTRQMDDLKKEIQKFNHLLSNAKTRGNFGEDVLEQIFLAILGKQGEGLIYRTQVNFTKEFGVKAQKDENGLVKETIVDFLYNVSTTHGNVPLSIDAKFPYDNYVPLLDETLSVEAREEAKKKFKRDVEARITEVTKYIIPGKTAPYAVMFVPAEAVFIDIFKEFPTIVEKARAQRIIIASPSLIVTILHILQFILKDYQLRNNADKILDLIDDIAKQFNAYQDRWADLKKQIENLNNSASKIDITVKKLTQGFDQANEYIAQRAPTVPKELDLTSEDKNK